LGASTNSPLAFDLSTLPPVKLKSGYALSLLQKIYRQPLKKITFLTIRPMGEAKAEASGYKTNAKAKAVGFKAKAKNFDLKAKANY